MGERKEFLKCICRVFLEEERILGEIKRKRFEPGRRGRDGGLRQPTRDE